MTRKSTSSHDQQTNSKLSPSDISSALKKEQNIADKMQSFGAEAEKYTESDVTLLWYNFLFKGAQNEVAGKRVKIFVMGKNEWRFEDEWPLRRAVETRYGLYSGNAANSTVGNGLLLEPGVLTRTSGSPSDTFT